MEPIPTTPNPASAPGFGASAAAAVCADPAIADILRRKAAGDKLTASEHGKLGNWKSRQPKLAASVPGAGNPSLPTVGTPGGPPPPTAPVVDAPVDLVPLPPGDADLVRGTVAAVLVKINALGQRHLLTAARAAGADAPALDRFSRAEVVSEEDRRVLSETAPLVAASMGVNARHVPVAAFFGTLGACGLNFMQAIAELKEIQAARLKMGQADDTKKP